MVGYETGEIQLRINSGENEFYENLDAAKSSVAYSRARFTFTNFRNWGLDGVQWYQNYFEGPAVYEDCQFREFNYGWNYLFERSIFDRCNFTYGTYVTKMFQHEISSYNGFLKDVNISNLDYYGSVNDAQLVMTD